MKFRSCFLALFGIGMLAMTTSSRAEAQSAVLSEIYGRGVHAYHSGQYDQASQWLSMAIDNGYRDPRAYYFRGLVAASSGRGYEAESDFQMGAELEAKGAFGNVVGQSLSRVQGSTRLKLEQIRDRARLQVLATGQARSKVRYGELGVEPAPMTKAPAGNVPAVGATRPRAGVMPPSVPMSENPFADDLGQDPTVESMDAFKGAMENAAEPNMPAGGNEPVGGDASPFGGDSAPASDPFGGGAPADDPFGAPSGGSDPFGGGGAMDDPFGASPF